MVIKVNSAAICGIDCRAIDVEIDISAGLPGLELVGLLSNEVREARERVKVALHNTNINLPPMKITINLAPASWKKEGTGYDLPIAMGILVGLGYIEEKQLENALVVGELGLDGEVRGVNGILPLVLFAKENGFHKVILPFANRREAAVIKGIEIVTYQYLEEIVDHMGKNTNFDEEINNDEQESIKNDNESNATGSGEKNKRKFNVNYENANIIITGKKSDNMDNNEEQMLETACRNNAEQIMETACVNNANQQLDFSDIVGQENMKRAVEIVAAGFHNMLMIGSPGCGKTMIAQRIPGILPEMSEDEMIEVSKIYSVAGLLNNDNYLITQRPFIAPHHTVTKSAFAGSGLVPKPGLVSKAHKGVLFLDEVVHFNSEVLETLRQPLEDKKIHIARSGGNYTFPSEIMLVAAMNPCPCGHFPDMSKCHCTPEQIRRYSGKISGPILDRIDLCVEATKVQWKELTGENPQNENNAWDSSHIRARVMKARQMQKKRYEGTGLHFNSELTPGQIDKYIILDAKEKKLLEKIYEKYELSARAYHRLLKVARTIADLRESEKVEEADILEAVSYRGIEKKYRL